MTHWRNIYKIPSVIKRAHDQNLISGVILFGSALVQSKPQDIDMAVITSKNNFRRFISMLSRAKISKKFDISLIKEEEIMKGQKFYFGGHGQYLVEAFRCGDTLLGSNPFQQFPITKSADIRSSIVERLREYIYVLRKSYFDKQAEIIFYSRYNKILKLFLFLTCPKYSYPSVMEMDNKVVIKKIRGTHIRINHDKKQNIENLWKKIEKQYL